MCKQKKEYQERGILFIRKKNSPPSSERKEEGCFKVLS